MGRRVRLASKDVPKAGKQKGLRSIMRLVMTEGEKGLLEVAEMPLIVENEDLPKRCEAAWGFAGA